MTILGKWKRRRAKREAVKKLKEFSKWLHSEKIKELMTVLERDPLLFGCDMDDYNPEQKARLEKAREIVA